MVTPNANGDMRRTKPMKYGLPAVELHRPELHSHAYSLSDASKELGISRQHIYRLVDQGRFPILLSNGKKRIMYRHLVSFLEHMESNDDCPLCPASFSLKGLMTFTRSSRSWSLKLIDKYKVRSYYIGNSRRFNKEDVVAAFNLEQEGRSEWIQFRDAQLEYNISRNALIRAIVDNRIRFQCAHGALLVNKKDIQLFKTIHK